MNSPAQIASNYVGIGEGKVKTGTVKLLLLSFLAGIFIAIGGTASSAASVTVENASLAKLISGCVFPAGLSMVLIAGSELFTGNCLLVIPLMEKRVKFSGVVRNLVLVYIGNLVGSIFLVLLMGYGGVYGLFGQKMAEGCVATAVAKCSLPFMQAFLKGILCNIFVCLAVWMAFGATTVTGKIVGLFFPIMVFVVCGFEHCVANMSYIPAGLFCKAYYGIDAPSLTISAFFLKNLLPVTLGNIVGGALVGLIYWYIYLYKKPEKQ